MYDIWVNGGLVHTEYVFKKSPTKVDKVALYTDTVPNAMVTVNSPEVLWFWFCSLRMKLSKTNEVGWTMPYKYQIPVQFGVIIKLDIRDK